MKPSLIVASKPTVATEDCGASRLSSLEVTLALVVRYTVIAYLREGATVTINYLPEEESDAQALAGFVAEEGYSIERIPGDLRNESFCADLVAEAHSRMGGIDVFVGNAG